MCVCLNDKTKRDEKIISCRFDTVCIQFKLEHETNTAKKHQTTTAKPILWMQKL